MPRGKRKFVIEITETRDITVGEISKALTRLGAKMHIGTSAMERGFVIGDENHVIGNYSWKDQPQWPEKTTR